MLNDPCLQTAEFLFEHLPCLVLVPQPNYGLAQYVFMDVGDRQTAFVVGPGLPVFVQYLGIEKGLFKLLERDAIWFF